MAKGKMRVELQTPDFKEVLQKLGVKVEDYAEDVVAEVARQTKNEVCRTAYIAEKSYTQYWNNGVSRVVLPAGTIPKLIY
ncbi:MAG: hypothetical protein IJM09_04275, partial [Neisseriaceae bacterium]|nr:hypothetical protein [Neisseriaceae bacterium]